MPALDPPHDGLAARYQEWSSEKLLVVATDESEEYTDEAVQEARSILLKRDAEHPSGADLPAAFAQADQVRAEYRGAKKPRMPDFLQLLTLIGVFVTAAGVLVALALGGKAGFWASKTSWLLPFSIFLPAFCAYCFIRRKAIGRQVFLGMHIATAVLSPGVLDRWLVLFEWISWILLGLFYYWYLFRKRGVLNYFGIAPQPTVDADS